MKAQNNWRTSLALGVITLALALTSAANAASATLYIGGDPGEGLDLSTEGGMGFVYGLNFRNTTAADLVVGDVTFKAVTATTAPADVTVTRYGTASQNNIAPYNFGTNTNDNNLELIAAATVEAGVVNLPTTNLSLDLTLAVTAGRTYKLQILTLGNSGAHRPGNYTINGVTTLIDLAPVSNNVGGNLTSAYVVTDTFVAASSSLQIIISNANTNPPSNDSFIQALTLELIPEPASLSLLVLGGLAVLGRRRARVA